MCKNPYWEARHKQCLHHAKECCVCSGMHGSSGSFYLWYFSSFFSFYWSKFSIANSFQQNNKYGTFIERFSYCKKHFCRQKQKSHGAAAILQAILDRSAALPPQHQCFEVPASADPMFWEQLGDTRVKSDQELLSSPLPLSFVYHEGKAQCNIQEIS